MPFFLYFWLRGWSKIVHHATLPSPQIIHSSHSCFSLLYFTKKQRCGACQTAGHPALPITEGQEHVEKQPILDLQYLGKLCSICQPTSPSVADIWQESQKAHYWQRDKAGEKNAPQIILKSRQHLPLLISVSQAFKKQGAPDSQREIEPVSGLSGTHWLQWRDTKSDLGGFSLLPLTSFFSGTEKGSSPWNQTLTEPADRKWSSRNMTVVQPADGKCPAWLWVTRGKKRPDTQHTILSQCHVFFRWRRHNPGCHEIFILPSYPVHTSTTHLKLLCQEVVLFTTVSTYADFYPYFGLCCYLLLKTVTI